MKRSLLILKNRMVTFLIFIPLLTVSANAQTTLNTVLTPTGSFSGSIELNGVGQHSGVGAGVGIGARKLTGQE